MSAILFFVPCRLVNRDNAREHRMKTHRRSAKEIDDVQACVVAAVSGRRPLPAWMHQPADQHTVNAALWRRWRPKQPKRVLLFCHVAKLMDDDGLRSACKSVRDGLVAARVIHGDGPRDGHAFIYDQVVSARRGVEIAVELLPVVGRP